MDVIPCMDSAVQANDLIELIPMVKIESGHPEEGPFGCEVSLGSYRGLKSQVIEDFGGKFAFFEKRPLMEKFSKFCSKRTHHLINQCPVCKFREIWPTEVGEIAHCLPDKKIRLAIASARSRPKSARAATDNVFRVPQISPKSVHFLQSHSRTREHRQNVRQFVSNIRPKPSFEPNN